MEGWGGEGQIMVRYSTLSVLYFQITVANIENTLVQFSVSVYTASRL